jgi:two-component sensor histidine kinase
MADGRQRLDLTWEERGGPDVSPPSRRGFGSRLIERQLPLEFDGTAEIDYRRAGVVCGLQIPLTALGWMGQDVIAGHAVR